MPVVERSSGKCDGRTANSRGGRVVAVRECPWLCVWLKHRIVASTPPRPRLVARTRHEHIHRVHSLLVAARPGTVDSGKNFIWEGVSWEVNYNKDIKGEGKGGPKGQDVLVVRRLADTVQDFWGKVFPWGCEV